MGSIISCCSWRRALFSAAAAMLLASGIASAGEAGRIVYVRGEVLTGARATVLGDAVQEGDELITGKDGYVYLKTVDDGLLILRPSSRARITAYHVDRQNPANTHVKLELLAGVARSVSGQAVKQARQNFRFNTPVAAIGVRGTDFTVFTDQETSNVTVLSGAIVVSGFGGACAPGGSGPCEHPSSRELSAGQMGQMLQVRRGQSTPQILPGSGVAPDAVSPPRADEPSAKPQASNEPSLDAQKTALLLQQGLTVKQNDVPVVPTVPPLVAPNEPVVTSPEVVQRQVVWGRWATVLGQSPSIDPSQLGKDKAEPVAINSYYAIFRTAGTDWTLPQQGAMGFALRQSEAVVIADVSSAMSAATLQNGQLSVDFAKRSFATSFDLLTGTDRFKLQAEGVVGNTGLLSGNSQFASPTNMAVNGAVSADNTAAYIFSTRLDSKRTAAGITYWGK